MEGRKPLCILITHSDHSPPTLRHAIHILLLSHHRGYNAINAQQTSLQAARLLMKQ